MTNDGKKEPAKTKPAEKHDENDKVPAKKPVETPTPTETKETVKEIE